MLYIIIYIYIPMAHNILLVSFIWQEGEKQGEKGRAEGEKEGSKERRMEGRKPARQDVLCRYTIANFFVEAPIGTTTGKSGKGHLHHNINSSLYILFHLQLVCGKYSQMFVERSVNLWCICQGMVYRRQCA